MIKIGDYVQYNLITDRVVIGRVRQIRTGIRSSLRLLISWPTRDDIFGYEQCDFTLCSNQKTAKKLFILNGGQLEVCKM